MDTQLIAAVLAAVAVMLVVWAVAGRSQGTIQARLAQAGVQEQRRSIEQIELEKPLFERTLLPLANRLSGVGRKMTSAKKVGRTERRLLMAGNPGGMRTAEFLGLKVVIAILTPIIIFLLFTFVMRNPNFAVLLFLPAAAFGFLGPEFWLTRRIKARRKAILLALPDTLDLLTISVRAGLGFDAALAKVVEKSVGPLSDEFRRVLAEVRVGKSRRESLRDLADRTEVPALSAFIAAIIQAEQLGVAISKVLVVQSDQLRIERRQRAEESAAKAPIKMMFPLVGCIFPSLFVVILGPALILIMANMGNM